MLLTKGVSIDMQNSDGWTGLFYASQNGYWVVVDMLLEKGASIDLRHKRDGFTALMLASEKGHGKVVGKLLTKGASIDVQQEDGRAPVWSSSEPLV